MLFAVFDSGGAVLWQRTFGGYRILMARAKCPLRFPVNVGVCLVVARRARNHQIAVRSVVRFPGARGYTLCNATLSPSLRRALLLKPVRGLTSSHLLQRFVVESGVHHE